MCIRDHCAADVFAVRPGFLSPDKTSRPRCLEVWRSAVSERPYAASDPDITAVISDDSASLYEGQDGIQVPIWPRTGVAEIADRILTLAKIGTCAD